MISKSIDSEFRRDIGRWFEGYARSDLDLGIITTVVSFQFVGKCSRRRQELNNFVIWRTTRFEECLRAVLVIRSGPGAVLLGNFFIIFQTSFGEIGESEGE